MVKQVEQKAGDSVRIVNIVTQMEAGGAQGAAIRMSEGFRSRGHSAETWFLYLKRPTYVEDPGVRVFLEHPPASVFDYLRIFWGLYRALVKTRPDGVITYTHYANIMGQVASRLARVSARVASQRNPGWTYPRAAQFMDKLLGSTGFYTTNICVSQTVVDSFATYPSYYKQHIRRVYNGIALGKSTLSKVEARQRFGLPLDVPLVLTVGRLAQQKNQALLIRMMRNLPDCHLAIAGDGELRQQLEADIRTWGLNQRVHLLGELPPHAIRDFLAAGDLFAFPSRFEAFGFAVFEAAAAGLPIVCSDIPALSEVLGASDFGSAAGILLPVDDDEAWASQVRSFFADPELATQLSLSSLQRAAHFAVDRMIDKYEAAVLRRP